VPAEGAQAADAERGQGGDRDADEGGVERGKPGVGPSGGQARRPVEVMSVSQGSSPDQMVPR
jgi:hypothetical protein